MELATPPPKRVEPGDVTGSRVEGLVSESPPKRVALAAGLISEPPPKRVGLGLTCELPPPKSPPLARVAAAALKTPVLCPLDTCELPPPKSPPLALLAAVGLGLALVAKSGEAAPGRATENGEANPRPPDISVVA